jgi:ABC-2 type transport system permease protein
MLRGFWKLTWLEIKIFVREPLGVLGSVVIPVAMFLVLGRALGSRSGNSDAASRLLSQDLPIFASVFIAMGAAMSLVAIVTIYREGASSNDCGRPLCGQRQFWALTFWSSCCLQACRWFSW